MTQRRKIHRFHLDGSGTEYPVRFKEDVLAAEEPLESASADSVRKTLPFDPAQDTLQIPVDVLAELPERLREAQAVFDKRAASMRPACSRWLAPALSCFVSGRMSDAITLWTKWWDGRCAKTCCI